MNNNHHYRYRIILAVLALLQAVAIYNVPLWLMLHQQPSVSFPVMRIIEDWWA